MDIKKWLALFIIAALWCSSASADTAIQLGWGLSERASWLKLDNGGRTGDECYMYDPALTNRQQNFLCSQRFRVNPGDVYNYEAWARTEGANGVFELKFIVFDDAGKQLVQLKATRMVDNAVDAKWSRYAGKTPYMPMNAAFANLALCARYSPPAIYVDDVLVTIAPTREVAKVFTSAYRELATDGERVRFVAPCRISPARHNPTSLRATFVYEGADEVRHTREVPIANGVAELSLDASELKRGTSQIVCELTSTDKPDFRCAATNSFTRVETLPARRVYIDSHQRFIVDGKPFLPLELSWDKEICAKGVREPHLLRMSKSPFNTVGAYRKNLDLEFLDDCHKYGLMSRCNLKDEFAGLSWLYPSPQIKTQADEEPFVKSVVERCKHHPALLLWYVNDEFPLSMRDRAARRYWFVRSLDDQHPIAMCGDKVAEFGDFVDTADVMGSDPYPIGAGRKLSMCTDWTVQTREQTYGVRSLWQTVQAFDWRWYGKKGEDCRFPTREEMRSMTWQQLIAGAKALSFYAYGAMVWRFTGREFERHWAELCAVGAEVRDREEAILSVEPRPEIREVPAGLVAGAWQVRGKVTYAVVNITDKPIKGTVVIAGKPISVNLAANATLLGD